MQRNTNRAERLQIMLAPEELEAIDNFRFENRMPSRAAAVREVMRRGLSATDVEPSLDGRRSAEFGVLAKGPSRDRPQGGRSHKRRRRPSTYIDSK
jgi:hypothetical protein